jgi:hypothetical protein
VSGYCILTVGVVFALLFMVRPTLAMIDLISPVCIMVIVFVFIPEVIEIPR